VKNALLFQYSIAKDKVCWYGLKQSLCAWFERFFNAMIKYGYRQSQEDRILFIKRQGSSLITFIVYVDDIVVTGNDSGEVKKLKGQMGHEFEIKDLGQ